MISNDQHNVKKTADMTVGQILDIAPLSKILYF